MEPESGNEKDLAPRPRPLVRFGRQLIRHVHSISFLCYAAGVLAILLLPFLAKNTYISENALMPGSGQAAFSYLDATHGHSSALKLLELVAENPDIQRTVSRWLVEEMLGVGADSYIHPFSPPASAFSSTRFPTSSGHFKWSTANCRSDDDNTHMQTCSAVNVVGIIRAPQGEGNEAVVLVTPYDSDFFGEDSALTLGIGVALFRRLSKALWLARDIVWLVPDSKYGAYPAVASWLKEYHNPSISQIFTLEKLKSDWLQKIFSEDSESPEQLIYSRNLGDFKRAGTIATGLVYELKRGLNQGRRDSVTVWAEGPNGQMPNLDFINIVNSIAAYRESLELRLETVPGIKMWTWLRAIGGYLEEICKFAKSLNPSWNFVLPAATYLDNMATLFSSMFFQVIGLPTGVHGAFRDYQVDAITLQFTVNKGQLHLVSKIGRLLEAVIRSVNNLLEKWHQSFFLYFLSAPNKYISVGVYMIPFGLLLLGLPLQAAALFYPVKENATGAKNVKLEVKSTSRKRSSEMYGRKSMGDDSGSWLQALVLVGAAQLWAFFAIFSLFLVSQTNLTAEFKLLSWSVILGFSLLIAFLVQKFFVASMNDKDIENGQNQNWATVKAVTLGITAVDLAVMSTINFPVALIGALTLVPMCIGAFPIEHSWRYAVSHGRSAVGIVALVTGTLWTLAISPLGLPVMIWRSYGHVVDITPRNVWNFAESLLQWRSALLPYILVIHLPCAVLCLYILLSRLPPQRP